MTGEEIGGPQFDDIFPFGFQWFKSKHWKKKPSVGCFLEF